MTSNPDSSSQPLARRTCVPCKGYIPPLQGAALAQFSAELPRWKVIEDHHIEKDFEFSDFRTALNFVQQVGDVAEEQGHHPDILLRWGKVKITIYTHKIEGLSESDFILGAKIDEIPRTSGR